MNVPEDLMYSEEHEWFHPTTGWMGITDFAQDELGDIVFVELPERGRAVSALDPFVEVESVKAISDVFAPASGTVAEVNDALVETPEQINTSPYERGRLVRLDVDEVGDHLIDAASYRSLIE